MIAKGAIIITSDDEIGQRGAFGKKVIFPTFELFSNPTINIGDVRSRRYNIIDRNVQKARQQIMAQEDESFFKALENICSKEK